MDISVVYSGTPSNAWIRLSVDPGCTALQAIQQSEILRQFPEIDLSTMKIGVFGKLVKPDTSIEEGDRIEIYRPITRVIDDEDDDDDDD